jgi:cbb3-type cytochrome oxidase subunit 3
MPVEIFIMIAVLMVTFFVVVMDMIMYAPGEKRQMDQARRIRVHTKSHHYKIGSRR